jgi:hypothetical protein
MKLSKCCINPLGGLRGLMATDSPHSVLMGMLLFGLSTLFVTIMGTCAKLLGTPPVVGDHYEHADN